MRLLLFLFSLLPSLFAQYSYEGQTEGLRSGKLIKLEIVIRDSPDPEGPDIKSVEFDKKAISLMPADLYGNRGSAGFDLTPGKYSLKWTVQRSKNQWPRDETFKEEVTVDPRDSWIQIVIIGDKASIR